jgi:PIN domain nuclease of toxin-antitoxin system
MSEPLLADTQALVWYLGADARIRERARRPLDRASADGALFASAIVLFEFGELVRIGRFKPINIVGWADRAMADGVIFLPFDADTATECSRLPGVPPRDPFDRMIIATSRVHGLTLATRDGAILDYGAAGHLRTLEI